jgi:type VI secretion system protein ImpF
LFLAFPNAQANKIVNMARIDNEIRIMPSVLDRLIDYEPELSREPLKSRSKSLRELKQSVRRDLEWLLNTRCHTEDMAEGLKEVGESLFTYGLSDFSSLSDKNPGDQKVLRSAIETALRNFEPRLQDVVVTAEPIDTLQRLMRFRIEARLRVDPIPEPVTFDTVLQLGNGQYQVQEK